MRRMSFIAARQQHGVLVSAKAEPEPVKPILYSSRKQISPLRDDSHRFGRNDNVAAELVKYRIRIFVTAACIACFLFPLASVSGGGQYHIDWYTIDGGGGTTSGGPYRLTGTIGQADAGYTSGGLYELLGGFWVGGPVECFPSCHKDYAQWAAAGKPACWCYPRQCHGDADGKAQGSDKTGVYYVGTNDLNVIIAAWQVREPPNGPGIASVPNGICADFAHDVQGSAKTGLMRVSTNDLNILIANWLVKELPKGPGIKPDCLDCP